NIPETTTGVIRGLLRCAQDDARFRHFFRIERCRFHRSFVRDFGSNASRTPSPINVANISVMKSAQTAEVAIHGACRFCKPCEIISPHDGVGGGRPKPRKSSAVSAEI